MEQITSGKTLGFALIAGVLAYGFAPGPASARFIFAGLIVVLVGSYNYHRFSVNERLFFKIDRQPVLHAAKAIEGVPYCSEGKIIPTGSLIAPVSKKECVYYHVIRERWEKRGKHSEWVMKENTMKYLPFYVEDHSGRLLVDLMNVDRDFSKVALPVIDRSLPNPKNSEIDATPTILRREYRVDKKWAFDEQWRESEYILEPHQKVFAYGMTSSTGSEPVLRESTGYPLIISRKTKDQYIDEFAKGSSVWYVTSIVMAMGFVLAMAGVSYFYPEFFTLGFIAGLSLITAHAILKSYNRFVLLRHRVENAESEIDIWVKKRNDLIPNLVEIVKGYAKFEKGLNELIANMRTDLMFYPLGDGKSQKSLIALLEAYPKLKASENFKSLMFSLEDVEESIAQTREFYNRSVLKYNNLCQQFPSNVLAGMMGMKPMLFLDSVQLGIMPEKE